MLVSGKKFVWCYYLGEQMYKITVCTFARHSVEVPDTMKETTM